MSRNNRTDVSETNHTLHYRGVRRPFRRRAGASGLRARHLGFRHHPRERRPRQPHFHGRQPRRQAAGDPRRGDLLRLHGARILAPSRHPGRHDADHRHVRPHEPPRHLHQGAVDLFRRTEENRLDHRAGQCHAPRKEPRRALPGRCRRGPAAGRDAQRLLLYISGTADAGGDRLRQRFGPHDPPLAASAERKRPAQHRRPAANRARPAGRDQPLLPHPGRQTPLRHPARRAGSRR